MKVVVNKEELDSKMDFAVNMICDAVSSTLGPVGSNVLINNSDTMPFITNDGVTIANNICSDDKVINTILEIIKESSLKTNDVVGDGTTTTLILFQSIYNSGKKLIEEGVKGIELKKELNSCLEKCLKNLDNLSKKPSRKDLLAITKTSSNDEEISNLITELYLKMKNKYSIKIEESKDEKTYYRIKKGYSFELDNISNLFFQDSDEIVLNNCYVSILKGYLSSLEQIGNIINEGINNKRNIIIFTEGKEESINQELTIYNLNNKNNIFIFNLPEYASRKEQIENDIKIISSCNIKNIDYESFDFNDLGLIEKVVIKKEEITLESFNKNVSALIKKLKSDYINCTNDYDKEFIEERLSKLENGIATIYVGGFTKTEKKEKMMRIDDALCAIDVSSSGIVLGEGVTYLQIASKLSEQELGEKVLKEALTMPFVKIIENIGQDISSILNNIIKEKYKKVYNYLNKKYESIDETTIMDPVNVLKEALKNSVSIASILLTTNYLVINDMNDYKENIKETL